MEAGQIRAVAREYVEAVEDGQMDKAAKIALAVQADGGVKAFWDEVNRMEREA